MSTPTEEGTDRDAGGGLLSFREVVAMGVGAMVGGGIFSVLGLAIAQAGHAAPIAFALGGGIAWLTGLSYARLGIAFRGDGGSFTYLERAFRNPSIGALAGWLLLAGYVGTLALYAFTFGAYGTALLGGDAHDPAMRHLLESLVLLTFLGINLYGVKETGTAELLIVTVKVLILTLFGVIGLAFVRPDHLLPVFDRGGSGVVLGAALIFVAYEGFELIPNAVNEMEAPERNLRRGILWSIAITVGIYVLVSLVAVGNLTPGEISRQGEYALAVAAQPFLGRAGFALISLAALFSTASAINATLFGTARLGVVMAGERALPRAFSFRRRANAVPWASLVLITAATLLFVNTSGLGTISVFASSTFLLVFAAINLSALRLRRRIGGGLVGAGLGLVLSTGSWIVLVWHLGRDDAAAVWWLGGSYLVLGLAELFFHLWAGRRPPAC